jgi:hypothetical protein
MTQTAAQTIQTNASQCAPRVFAANLAALAASQPAVARLFEANSASVSGLTWLRGRDGSLTAKDADGRWWSGSSLPLQVGRSLMRTLELEASVGCFLCPATAGQIRAVLEKIAENQAVIVVIPETARAVIALHCNDFAQEIRGGRLWLAVGTEWPSHLGELLTGYPGLCVPRQYIRNGLMDDAGLGAMTAIASPILSEVIAQRDKQTAEIANCWRQRSRSKKICVVTGSRFKLWDIAGATLAKIFGQAGDALVLHDADRPASASPLSLALAAEDCDAIFAADIYRADLSGILPDEMTWLTWATQPRFQSPAPGDQLLLADESWRPKAIAAGWATDRIHIAAWPTLLDSTPIPGKGPFALIADAHVRPMPKRLRDFSSQCVLWESISTELSHNPFALGTDIDAYLDSRMAQLEISRDALDRNLFRRDLILPAWLAGIAKAIAKAGLPITTYGAGWPESSGSVESFEDLQRAVSGARAIVHPNPAGESHPVYALGRPVVTAAQAVRGSGRSRPIGPVLAAQLIRAIIG